MVDVAIIEQLSHFREIVFLVLNEFLYFFNFQFDEIFFYRNILRHRKQLAGFGIFPVEFFLEIGGKFPVDIQRQTL